MGLRWHTAAPSVDARQEIYLAGAVDPRHAFQPLRVRATRGQRTWDTFLPVREGAFWGKVPLNGGGGGYRFDLAVMESGGQYRDLGAFTLENPHREVVPRPDRHPAYYLRRFRIVAPTLDEREVRGAVHIQGAVHDTRWFPALEVVVRGPGREGRQQAPATMPLKDGEFAGDVPLTLGPGRYTLTLRAPAVEKPVGDKVTMEPVLTFHVLKK